MNRSFLFVPADSERKMKRAGQCGADALILDLEDSVAADAKPAARDLARKFLDGRNDVWVRINPVDTDDAPLDLEAVIPASPAGIVLPKPRSAGAVTRLAKRLDELEAGSGIEPGSIGILPICTETPDAIFTMGGYSGDTPRLAGLTWGGSLVRW